MSALDRSVLVRDLPPDARARVGDNAVTLSLRAGETLLERGQAGRDVYVVLHGSLEVLDGDGRAVARLEPGDVVGERALLNGGYRNATVRARRDTDVAELAEPFVRQLLDEHPAVVLALAGLLAERVSATPVPTRPSCRTITVVPRSPWACGVAHRLIPALAELGPATLVDAARAEREVGSGASTALPGTPIAGRVSAWLDRLEAAHATVVLLGGDRRWTARCLRGADTSVALCDSLNPLPSGFSGRVVVLRRGGDPVPGLGTVWSSRVATDRLLHVDVTSDADVERLARVLTGRAVGVVLGGGGARGFAHLGVLRAFETCGISIDAVGGTSIGALIGATYATGWSAETRERKALGGLLGGRKLLGWTLPLVSITSARRLTDLLRSDELFGERAIEDLPLPFFAVSASFRTGDAVVHDRGPVWFAARASSSLPGIMPPVCHRDDLLVDGGVVNNVPVDVMQERLAGRVVAVNLRGRAPTGVQTPFDPALSGWTVLASRLHPRRQAIRLPGPASMMLRAKELGAKQSHHDRLARADLLIEPPVGGVDNLDFKAGLPLVEPAYRYACESLEAWLSPQDTTGAVPN